MDLLQVWASQGNKSNPGTDQWVPAARVVVVKHGGVLDVTPLQPACLRIDKLRVKVELQGMFIWLVIKTRLYTVKFPQRGSKFSNKDNMEELCLAPHLLTDVSQHAWWNSLKCSWKRWFKLLSPHKNERKLSSFRSKSFLSLVAMRFKKTANLISSSRIDNEEPSGRHIYFGKTWLRCSTSDVKSHRWDILIIPSRFKQIASVLENISQGAVFDKNIHCLSLSVRIDMMDMTRMLFDALQTERRHLLNGI